MINAAYANTIYDILVQYAGEVEDDWSRHDFIHSITVRGVDEYRFQGGLGFGGKLYFGVEGPRVSCYHEDLTNERENMIKMTNEALKVLL